jgi:hypothetical protein
LASSFASFLFPQGRRKDESWLLLPKEEKKSWVFSFFSLFLLFLSPVRLKSTPTKN